MSLVLEEIQPILFLAVYVNFDLDGAGVDLLGLVEIFEDTLGLEVACADRAQIHEADGLVIAAQLVAQLHVAVKGSLRLGVVDSDVFKHRVEGGMAAVVRPVGIHHLDLGDGGAALLLIAEVSPEERDIRQVHSKPALVDKGLQARGIELVKALQNLDGLGLRMLHLEGGNGIQRRLARLDGVDHVVFDGIDICRREIALQIADLGAAHVGALAAADELHALACRVCPLVKLAGQILHGKNGSTGGIWQLKAHIVGLRLAKNSGHALGEELVADPLYVVAVNQTHSAQSIDLQDAAQLTQKLLRLYIKARLLFDIHA